MKVKAIETLACDAGWRNYHFVKLTTDDGIVGWSEFDEGFGSPGVGTVIERLAPRVVGQQVGEHERIYAELYCATRPGSGGVVAQAHGRHRERAARRQGQGARRAVLRAARRQGARPHPRVLVALRDVAHQSSDLLQARHHRPRRRQGDRPRGAREELHRAQDQHLHLRGRRQEPQGLAPGLRRAVLSRAQRRPHRAAQPAHASGSHPRGRRPRRRPAARPQLQRQDRRLSQDPARDRRPRHVLDRDRHLQPGGAGLHPPPEPAPDLVVRDAAGPARVPALFPRAGHGRRHRRHALERRVAVDEDRGGSPRRTRSTSPRTTSTATCAR